MDMANRIAICAGHHGAAVGAKNVQYDLDENGVAKRVVLLVDEILGQYGLEVFVIDGRLREKVIKINRLHAEKPIALALDVHFNADADHLDPDDFNDARGDGCMVMYNPGNEPRMAQAALFSQVMAQHMSERDLSAREGWWWGKVGEDGRPIHKDYFLRKTDCPAFIPEPGYIDNNGFAERRLLGRPAIDRDNWHLVAAALSSAVISHCKTYG